jgi:hypothetical protein
MISRPSYWGSKFKGQSSTAGAKCENSFFFKVASTQWALYTIRFGLMSPLAEGKLIYLLTSWKMGLNIVVLKYYPFDK